MAETDENTQQEGLPYLCWVKRFPHFTLMWPKNSPRDTWTKSWSGWPPSWRCNGPLKPPRGDHTCKGRNWAEVFTLQVASGSACWPVPGLCRDSSPSGWVIAHLLTDHQAQWTINLNHTAPQYVFWYFLRREILLIPVFHEQACAKNRVERFQCLRWLSPVPQAFGKIDGRRADWTSFNMGGWGGGHCKSCPSEKCEVKEIWLANAPLNLLRQTFLTGGLKAQRPPNPLPTLQETSSCVHIDLPDKLRNESNWSNWHFFFPLQFQAVKSGLKTTCKCHGVSGSCAVRTCWKQLAPFHDTGRLLKYRYDNAVRVLSVTNEATGETELAGPRRHSQNLRTMDLVYLEESPSFCRASRYSPGTGGRSCAKDTSCQSLCCGRGYNTAMHLTSLSCHCQVRWCCHVECQTCVREEEVYTCKTPWQMMWCDRGNVGKTKQKKDSLELQRRFQRRPSQPERAFAELQACFWRGTCICAITLRLLTGNSLLKTRMFLKLFCLSPLKCTEIPLFWDKGRHALVTGTGLEWIPAAVQSQAPYLQGSSDTDIGVL